MKQSAGQESLEYALDQKEAQIVQVFRELEDSGATFREYQDTINKVFTKPSPFEEAIYTERVSFPLIFFFDSESV